MGQYLRHGRGGFVFHELDGIFDSMGAGPRIVLCCMQGSSIFKGGGGLEGIRKVHREV